MIPSKRLEAKQILEAFFHRTVPAKKRYLWTDSFAIVGFVKLGQRKHAVELANQVIEVLGTKRHTGEWLSGNPDRPTLKGLRIGKPLDERKENEAFDDQLEWDRDGQYYHYSTKFAWALQILAASDPSESKKYLSLAWDLMQGTNKGFIHYGRGTPRMYWKMDVGLSRPLVFSQGQHDALDGYITCLNLGFPPSSIQDLRKMALSTELTTTDLLGIGGLLIDCARMDNSDQQVFKHLKESTERSLFLFLLKAEEQMTLPATERLCFREMGLSIGSAMAKSKGVSLSTNFEPLKSALNDFWTNPQNRNNAVYKEHQDINDVMRACSLIFDELPSES